MRAMRVVFMGTAEFSLKALSAIYENREKNNCDIIAVYTQAPKPSGRNQHVHKSAVHEFAEMHNIPVFIPKSLRKPEQAEIFAKLAPDLTVVSSYGLIIPQNILEIPQFGFINIHASVLPRWRGAAPIQAAILAGDNRTGITIMKMDAGVDTGDIIRMQYVDITPKTTHGELSEVLGELGAQMIVETLKNLDKELSKAKKQPEEGAVYAPKISKEDCKIDWNISAENIQRKIMAFSPVPGAWGEIEGLRVKILDASVVGREKNTDAFLEVGEIFSDDHGEMFVKCSDEILQIIRIQPAGKNVMSGNDFLRGRRNLAGKKFQ